MEIDRIYSELILEASNSKKNFRKILEPDVTEPGHNPSCGDELVLMVKFEGDIIADASYIGEGCALSRASSSFMIDVLKGKTKKEALEIIENYLDMIRGEELTKEQLRSLKDARIFESIKKLPARVKCATLAWHTMKNILNQ